MRYDLIIDGTTIIENIEAVQPYSTAEELLKAEYLPLLAGTNPGVSGLGKGDDRAAVVMWNRVTTVEARIRQ